MAEKINNLIFQLGPKEYEFSGGGSGSPGANSVGSEQIMDDSVGMEDLKPEVRAAIAAGGTPATDSDIDELFPEGGGSSSQGDKEFADNSDIDELFSSGGQQTPTQDGDGPVDDDF